MTETIIFVILAFILGCIADRLSNRNRSIGNLRIDNSDPDGPYLFLELNCGPESFDNKKYVILKVNAENFISHD